MLHVFICVLLKSRSQLLPYFELFPSVLCNLALFLIPKHVLIFQKYLWQFSEYLRYCRQLLIISFHHNVHCFCLMEPYIWQKQFGIQTISRHWSVFVNLASNIIILRDKSCVCLIQPRCREKMLPQREFIVLLLGLDSTEHWLMQQCFSGLSVIDNKLWS